MRNSIERHLRRRRLNIVQEFADDLPADALKVTLCDLNSVIVAAWAREFSGYGAVEIIEGSFLETDGPALVCPANSVGDMGGGLDKIIDDYFKGAAQSALMATIREQFWGELPVGVAAVIAMEHRRFPFLIAAPTMRIPGSIAGTINAYLAMRAVLVAILRHNRSGEPKISGVAISGLGTGVGGLGAHECAEQMRVAYDNILRGGWKRVVTPVMAPYAHRRKPQFPAT